jgi:ATP-dependent Lon protease
MTEPTQDVKSYPILPLRDLVPFPGVTVPLFVGRSRSIAALERALRSSGKTILLVTQKNAETEDPQVEDLHETGVLASIVQILKMSDGTVKVLVEGHTRVRLIGALEDADVLTARCEHLLDPPDTEQDRAWGRALLEQFERYAKLSKKISGDVVKQVQEQTLSAARADVIMAHLSLEIQEKQDVLCLVNPLARQTRVLEILDREIDLIEVERRIRDRVKKQIEKSQREYYLNEQVKAIHKELGDLDGGQSELDKYKKKIDEAGLSAEAAEKAAQELSKLKMMQPMSAEATVVRNYLDWLTGLPWKKKSRLRHDIAKASSILDADHYGLDDVKERILEYLAVQKRAGKVRGSVLCLVGPPGVGKTSLGESIARATNRKFVRIALGGVRDEAEIRGHRRTYIGALPGKLIQKISRAGTSNPLILLDEIDKMGMDMRGDPASALLEVLDPEQNCHFSDHYLEVEYDLSDVMFICTANSMNIPPALLDRLEVVRLPGYTEDEKLRIAETHLMERQIALSGLRRQEVDFHPDTFRDIIRYYTREAGVRNLERAIARICRKVVLRHIDRQSNCQTVLQPEDLDNYLGVRKFRFGAAEKKDRVGQVTGLAWTEVGGDLLTIEATTMPGKGQLIKTGSLGDVMKESIQAALTVVRARSETLGCPALWHEQMDVHIHVPEGATPKDGPSAGIGMVTALVSALLAIPVRADVAMTGEVTLSGQVLAIGGLKEKLLAAHRGGIQRVVIPEENRKDLRDIPDNVLGSLDICPVSNVEEVLEIALSRRPVSLKSTLPGVPASVDSGKAGRSHH